MLFWTAEMHVCTHGCIMYEWRGGCKGSFKKGLTWTVPPSVRASRRGVPSSNLFQMCAVCAVASAPDSVLREVGVRCTFVGLRFAETCFDECAVLLGAAQPENRKFKVSRETDVQCPLPRRGPLKHNCLCVLFSWGGRLSSSFVLYLFANSVPNFFDFSF